MQQNHSDGRRTIEAANNTSLPSYKPNIIPLRGTYVAMIFRRSCRNPLDLRPKS